MLIMCKYDNAKTPREIKTLGERKDAKGNQDAKEPTTLNSQPSTNFCLRQKLERSLHFFFFKCLDNITHLDV